MGKIKLISDKDIQKLVVSLATGSGDKGASDDDAQIVCNWANLVRVNAETLAGVMSGKLVVCVREGELGFRTPDAHEAKYINLAFAGIDAGLTRSQMLKEATK